MHNPGKGEIPRLCRKDGEQARTFHINCSAQKKTQKIGLKKKW